MPQTLPSLVIAGTHSGCGKTTVTAGILRALTLRGLKVQAFKAGPDFIDPTYHAFVTQRPARNLDTWMIPHDALLELFERAGSSADICVIEGVMGLFDGFSALDESGSTAHLAKLLRAPVILVLDASALARSAAAMVLGYQAFDEELNLAGVLLNNVGAERHAQLLKQAIQQRCKVPVLGFLPRQPDFAIPERHLGLIPQPEQNATMEKFNAISDAIEQNVDIDAILAIAHQVPNLPTFQPSLFFQPTSQLVNQPTIAVARDEAFCFYYEDNLDLLRHYGAEIVEFSPLRDSHLPEGTGLVYLGGGFPEMFAKQLAANETMKQSLRDFAASGGFIYAECAGLMYLCRLIETFGGTGILPVNHAHAAQGESYPMVGLLPAKVQMQRKLAALGYLRVRAVRDSFLLRVGEEVRGHEFHYSVAETSGEVAYAYEVEGLGAQAKGDGLVMGNVLASYVHIHFASFPKTAQRLVGAAGK